METYSSGISGSRMTTNTTSHFGWPLTTLAITRQAPEIHTLDPQDPITKVSLDWPALLYDSLVMAALTLGSFLYFLPWREFPRARFVLADVFVLVTCASIGGVMWHQMYMSGREPESGDAEWFFLVSVSYLIVTLAAAGSLNGFMARARSRRQGGAIAK